MEAESYIIEHIIWKLEGGICVKWSPVKLKEECVQYLKNKSPYCNLTMKSIDTVSFHQKLQNLMKQDEKVTKCLPFQNHFVSWQKKDAYLEWNRTA